MSDDFDTLKAQKTAILKKQRIITEEEAAVIDAARELVFFWTAAQHGPVLQSALQGAEKALWDRVSELLAESDGHWISPY